MPRRVARKSKTRKIKVTPGLQLLVTIPQFSFRKRCVLFFHHHVRLVGIGSAVVAAVILVIYKEHRLAAVSVLSVGDELLKLVTEIVVDRVFPGGEFTKEV